MITDVLPPSVVAPNQFVDPPSVMLLAVEGAYVASAVDSRRRDFATVRQCARAALEQLGYPPMPLVPGDMGHHSGPAVPWAA